MAKELDNSLRLVTLFQLDSDRAKFTDFVKAVTDAGYKQGSDFWKNPGGEPSISFKNTVLKDKKVDSARGRYNMTGFGFEEQEAGSYIKESTYVVGEKVKVLMPSGKKILGEVKKIAYGDGFYLVEVGGKTISRSLHEMEPFNETKDKTIKTPKTKLSLDEAISCAMEEKHFTDEEGEMTDEAPDVLGESSESLNWITIPGGYKATGTKHVYQIEDLGEDGRFGRYALHIDSLGNAEKISDECEELEAYAQEMENGNQQNGIGEEVEESFEPAERKKLINREKGNMSIDELVDEAVNMVEISEEFNLTEDGAIDYGDDFSAEARHDDSCFEGYSNCCNAPVYGETDICPKCGEHCEVGPGSEEGIEDAIEDVWPDKGVKEEDRNAQLVGAPLEEDHLSSRDEKVQFIIDNCEYIPDDSSYSELKYTIETNKEAGLEWLASYGDDIIDSLYYGLETAMDQEGVDYKVSAAIDNAKGAEFQTEDLEEGKDPEPVMEAKSTERFKILKEDIETVTNIAKNKGYKVVKVQGELVESKKEGVMNILVEKNGRRAVITYNDNLNVKPWSWNGTQFNFMQEALESIYVTTKQILKEGKLIEKRELKEGVKNVEQILEQRKYAAKTDKLPLTEKQRREQRSQEILKKMLNGDLIKRKFDR